jgi:DNA-binding transcriptional LysR family regulator
MSPRHKHDLPIKALRAFIAISEHGSFSRAAKELKLSQPAISAQIKGLQRTVGGDLFFRRASGVGLTELGESVARHARRIVTLNDQVITTAGRAATQETVRLGVQTTFVRTVLPNLLKISERVNDVTYRHCWTNARDLEERYHSGYLELVCMVLPTRSRLNLLAEWKEKLVWVRAPHKFPVIAGEPIPFIGRHEGFIDRAVLEALDEQGIRYQIAVHTSDLATMIAAVQAGLGMMTATERAVPESLIAAPEHNLPKLPELRVGVLYKEGFDLARHKPLVDAFVSAVRPASIALVKLPNNRSGVKTH